MDLVDHLHPATVHFPIALLWVASAAGLAHLYWRPLPWLHVLTWSTLILGWLADAAAVLTGLLAQSGLPPQAPYRGVLNWHISAGLASLVVYGLLIYLGWIQRSRATRPLRRGARERTPPSDLLDDRDRRTSTAALLVAGALLVLAAGWNGGQLVYVWGVNVMK